MLETQVILKLLYMDALKAKSLEEVIKTIRNAMGEEDAALVEKNFSEEEKK